MSIDDPMDGDGTVIPQMRHGSMREKTSTKSHVINPVFGSVARKPNWEGILARVQETGPCIASGSSSQSTMIQYEGTVSEQNVTCYKCQLPGHIARNCPAKLEGMHRARGREIMQQGKMQNRVLPANKAAANVASSSSVVQATEPRTRRQ